MSNAINSLRANINCALKVREDIGADKQPVQLVTRTWTGRERGDGSFTDVVVNVTPTPGLKSLAHNIRGQDGGFIKQTDLIIKNISQVQFATESEVDGSSANEKIEKFYRIGGVNYRVISVVQKHVTWHVQVRRMTTQAGNTNLNQEGWRDYEGS